MPLPAILRPFYRALPLLALVSLIPLTSPAADEGFTSLFDGSTFAGWKAETATGYQAEKGVLRCTPEGKHLVSEKTYGNFHLKFEFKLSEGANNGMGIRCDDIKPGSKAAPHLNGMEIQIIDANVPKHATIKDWQHHGSIYGVVPARREGMKPVGEWNTEEIIAQGTRVKVILNGVTIVDADLATQKPSTGTNTRGCLTKRAIW